ncbi:MAG: hypothetical protein ACE5J3_09630 [Methanosarcinales archaeon]
MNDSYIEKAKEFFERGKREYEEGLKERDAIKVREGCEKIFHSFVEISNGILSEHGIQIPKDHIERSQKLDTLGLGTTYDSVKERLHDTCYYGEIIKPDWLKHAIDSIREEIERWSNVRC